MKRHKHSLSNYQLTTCNPGELVPVGCVEVLPGDTFQAESSMLLRLSPLMAPVMHPLHVRLHHFFVPTRLLWSGWEKFITGQVDFNPPTMVDSGATRAKGDLLDHLGVPPEAGLDVLQFPVNAYNRIFNEYYRDQDLETEVPHFRNDVQRISWGKDYFTSARPWAQKGGEVSLPLAGSAPLTGQGYGRTVETLTGSIPRGQLQGKYDLSANPSQWLSSASPGLQTEDVQIPVDLSTANADLTSATAATVRDVRTAFALQRFNEARARYGSRYVEYLRYCGVRSSDARLQRPEYLGGGKHVVSFSEVLQTAEGTNPVGTMRGHGISGMKTNRYRRFFEEHGYVLTLLSTRPKAVYANGVHRMWNRRVNEDWYQKELEFIGQQAVLNKEVYADGTAADSEVFGYSDRYREYRESPSQISGDFRDVLDHWHVARKFTTRPALNDTFTKCNPSSRIFAAPSADTLWVAVNNRITARRMVSRNASARII